MNIKNISIIDQKTNFFYNIKNHIINKIESKNYKEYYYTFILGDKSYIDDDVLNTFKQNGITHLFALSGMHVTLFIMILTKIFNFFHLNLKIKNIFIIMFLLFYLCLTNFTASILRTIAFFIFRYINQQFKLDLKILEIFYLTILFLILINPFLIFNIGFLYSVLASLGLIICSNKLKGNNYIIKIISTSLIATIFTLPITLYNFYEINILSIFINVIFIPMISFIIYPLILLSFFLPLSFLPSVFINLLEFLARFLTIFNLKFYFPKVNIIFFFIYYFLLLLAIYWRKGFFILIIMIEAIILKFSGYLDKNNYVYFLNVGQGDSIVIKSKYNKEVIMIDTGGKIGYHISDDSITFLKSIGVSKIDTLILTHGDYDHMGDAIHLVNNFKVEKVIFNNNSYNELEQELINVLKKREIKYYKNIRKIKEYYLNLYFLNTKIYNNENDNSNVIYTNINGYKFLFMADAGIAKEKDLLAQYNLKRIEFLKVGHHGSNTSSSKEFIDKIKPQYSIISVGKNNLYGHPKKEVLNTLAISKIYRTDIDGSILIILNNNGYKIKKNLS